MKNYQEVEEFLLETASLANDYFIQKKISAHEELIVIQIFYQGKCATKSLVN